MPRRFPAIRDPVVAAASLILLVEDDADCRASTAAVLEGAGYAVRQAATGEEALELVQDEAPRLALLDVCLPGISGYQVCHELRQRFGEGLPIVFFSAGRTESYDRVAGLLVGGSDYLAKPVAPDELLIRLRNLIRHSAPIEPAVAAKLTARELEVLRLLAEGLGPSAVAARLSISPKTVATHTDHILSKLGVHSRTEAVAVAFRRDLFGTAV